MKAFGHPLREKVPPPFGDGDSALRVVDLFCGCGGLTLGIGQAARRQGLALDVALAVDNDEDALAIYKANFGKANTSSLSIEELFDGGVGNPLSKKERAMLKEVGSVHAIVGGPPCQGHSDLNNHTRRADPKNELYLRMVRAVEVFRPPVALIENVPAVIHSCPDVVSSAKAVLTELGYSVSDRIIYLNKLGVPQARKRHVLLAIHSPGLAAEAIFTSLEDLKIESRDLRWAIGDLANIVGSTALLDQAPKASKENLHRMKMMIQYGWWDLPAKHRPVCHQDGNHSYVSMYGRLYWDRPAQTITSGFTSIGQGRYMHPDNPRALTHHEAARIQGFPDYFDFSAVRRRTSLATTIGNAVPPALGYEAFSILIPHVVAQAPN
jgi:DNA (cytosine-5)-methyltransferase 1